VHAHRSPRTQHFASSRAPGPDRARHSLRHEPRVLSPPLIPPPLRAGYAAGNAAGFAQLTPTVETVASLLCIGGIAGLATQKTARLGNASGIAGISLGLVSTLGSVHWDLGTYAQVRMLMGASDRPCRVREREGERRSARPREGARDRALERETQTERLRLRPAHERHARRPAVLHSH
jgi:hypothetical protein